MVVKSEEARVSNRVESEGLVEFRRVHNFSRARAMVKMKESRDLGIR